MLVRFAGPILALLMTACRPPAEPSSLAEQLPVHRGLNVLVISFDALRADALGLYGYARPTSPNLDRFAEESLVFEHAYAAAPVTPTSFAAAFTGQLPLRVFSGWKLVETDTIASVFSDAGYYSFALLNNLQLVAERNFQQGWSRYEVVDLPGELLLEQAIARIDEAADQRFFGWIHFISPHTPYDRREMARVFYEDGYAGRFAETTEGNFEVKSDAELKRVRDLYDGEVFFGDHLFGRLIAHLRKRELMEETLIVVTSDHGEEFMEHGGLQHDGQYEEVIRIPLLIRHPDVRTGSRTGAPFLNVDLLPTLAAVAGVPAPTVPDGLNLTKAWRKDRLRLSVGMTRKNLRQISGTRGHQKLIVTCRPEYLRRLFDLQADPGETEDRAR
jgi:arylsulfatase